MTQHMCVGCDLKISRRGKTWSVARTGRRCRNSKHGGIPEDLGEDGGLPGGLNSALKENSVGRKAKAEKYAPLRAKKRPVRRLATVCGLDVKGLATAM